MRWLVTGAAGFIGAHICEHLLRNTEDDVVGLVSFRHRGCAARLWHLEDRLRVVYHDLVGPMSSRVVEAIGNIDVVLNAASESHVDRSIADPVGFVRNNVDVALNMLEYARLIKPRIFVHVSTDEVYGPTLTERGHAEWSTIRPSNPYAASKAAQEAIAHSYWRTYQVPLLITNTMNNFGERQDVEKFIPKTMNNLLHGNKVIVHGTPTGKSGSRFWLHARNHADALLYLCRHYCDHALPMHPDVAEPARYNVVGDREVSNLEMAQRIAAVLECPLDYEIVDFHSQRPGHDLRYALDGRKLAELGWSPPVTFEESLERTIRWTLNHAEWLAADRKEGVDVELSHA